MEDPTVVQAPLCPYSGTVGLAIILGIDLGIDMGINLGMNLGTWALTWAYLGLDPGWCSASRDRSKASLSLQRN